MAHHQKHQTDHGRRGSAIQGLFKLFSLASTHTTVVGDDELAPDEPPDDQVSELATFHKTCVYPKFSRTPSETRRESLLTRAIKCETKSDDGQPTSPTGLHSLRGLSTGSSHSAASMASTAELTSDGDLTSATRSATPSPPSLQRHLGHFHHTKHHGTPLSKIVVNPVTQDELPVGEDKVEKQLGHKRRIMFACAGLSSDKKNDSDVVSSREKTENEAILEAPKRKSMLTFACPSRQQPAPANPIPAPKPHKIISTPRRPSPAPQSKRRLSIDSPRQGKKSQASSPLSTVKTAPHPKKETPTEAFHEFASSHDDVGAWVNQTHDDKPKLTLDDCMKKELAIRKLGQEAEEEADEEDLEAAEVENLGSDEDDEEDDFAPSDESDQESNGGNESDDEGGFAESDDESEAESEYQFWAPSTARVIPKHFSARLRSRSSTLESVSQSPSTPPFTSNMNGKRLRSSASRHRPGTPELPDSTDFVPGTLDEDRPLEAAYIACLKQRQREKQVVIPQDIDPSFPTSDPEDNEIDGQDSEETDQEYLNLDSSEAVPWIKSQRTSVDVDAPARRTSTPVDSLQFPKPINSRRPTNRSPPPRHARARSPPPRRLFGNSPAPRRSPPFAPLRSPRGSPVDPADLPIGQAVSRLAHRPMAARTSSLPRNPNPFFRNYKVGSTSISNIASGAVTPDSEEPPVRSDLHVRGPVDIKIGLENKRQKRKEKFWRQHCRKTARDQALKKTVPGRGAERMKELGLACEERNRGYGLAQPTALVLSL